jgi:hypothetical protein
MKPVSTNNSDSNPSVRRILPLRYSNGGMIGSIDASVFEEEIIMEHRILPDGSTGRSPPTESDIVREYEIPPIPCRPVNFPTPLPAGAQNIHIFDGKLLRPQITSRTIGRKMELFHEFINKFRINHPLLAMVMNDTGKPPNYLFSDNLWADDILAEIAEYALSNNVDVDTVRMLFAEQLIDLQSGTCPSGRVTRFLQILIAIKKL